MRRAAAGVTVVTTTGPAGRSGATVSAMCSVSADPPSLLVCIHHQSATAPKLIENGGFCVNLLAESQHDVAEWFAGMRSAPDVDKFDCATWRDLGPHGLALEGAVAAFGCRVTQSLRVGTHFVVVGEPVVILHGDGVPLIYSDRQFGRPHLKGAGAFSGTPGKPSTSA